MKLDDLLMTQFIVHFVERYAIYHACAKGILHKDLPAPSATREVIPVAWSLDWAGRPIMTEAIIAAISREKWTDRDRCCAQGGGNPKISKRRLVLPP
jgi:hypothetical protein